MKINYLLGYDNLKIYQDDSMFKFSIDSVLLPNFVTISKKTKKILDIGCGNGVIPIVLSTRTNALIDGVEIQKEVYDMAVKSIELNNLDNQINIYNEDIKKYSEKQITDVYDTITCNPPYFKDNMVCNSNEAKTFARHEKSLNILLIDYYMNHLNCVNIMVQLFLYLVYHSLYLQLVKC